jgi:hypothetical protein
MKRRRIVVASLVLPLTVCLVLAACGDDGGETAAFRGKLIDFKSGRAEEKPVPRIKIKAIDNDTGKPLAGFETVSDASGMVTFDGLPGEKVGFLAEGVLGESVDTYQFNIKSVTPEEYEILWLVDLGTYQMGPGLAGITLDTSKGVAAGAVYWANPQGQEEIVGCTTIKADPESGDVRYFGDGGMPTKLTSEDPQNGRDSTNKLNGYYLIGNIEPGSVKVNAYVDGESKGNVDFVTFGESICISNIYLEGDSNPQSQDCQ